MVLRSIDSHTLRFLELHETRVHALPNRTIHDLGDVVLLHDPNDPEPFWNRAAAITWPADTAAFDRRLDELITLFATLDRLPHVWPRAAFAEPPDLVDRLYARGFDDMGRGDLMVLEDPSRLRDVPRPSRDVEIATLRPATARDPSATVGEFAAVVVEAFGVEPERRASLEAETLTQAELAPIELYVARVDGEPAAVAKRATFDGATYLSTIGTLPAFRGRGLGALVTARAASDGLAAGGRLVHLGVFDDNVVARRLYERLGFAIVGEPVPDLLLRR